MVASPAHAEIVKEPAEQPGLFGEVLEVQKRLRSEEYLVAAERDIQFMARKHEHSPCGVHP